MFWRGASKWANKQAMFSTLVENFDESQYEGSEIGWISLHVFWRFLFELGGGVVVHSFDPSTQDAEMGGPVWVRG